MGGQVGDSGRSWGKGNYNQNTLHEKKSIFSKRKKECSQYKEHVARFRMWQLYMAFMPSLMFSWEFGMQPHDYQFVPFFSKALCLQWFINNNTFEACIICEIFKVKCVEFFYHFLLYVCMWAQAHKSFQNSQWLWLPLTFPLAHSLPSLFWYKAFVLSGQASILKMIKILIQKVL